MDTILLETFKKKVKVESTYDKLCTYKEIDKLINYFDVDVKKINYSKTISNPLEKALFYYKKHFPDYYEIIIDGIKSGKILISDKIKQSVTYLDTGESHIKPFNNDSDVFEFIHEFAHYIDLYLYPHLISKYRIFSEVVPFYYEKDFEKHYKRYYSELIRIRKNNRLFYEREMLQVIKYMLDYENHYRLYGNIDNIIDEHKIRLIMDYRSSNLVNFLLRYPIANLISSYMLIHNIEMCQNIDEYIVNNINLFEVMDDKDVKRAIILK